MGKYAKISIIFDFIDKSNRISYVQFLTILA